MNDKGIADHGNKMAPHNFQLTVIVLKAIMLTLEASMMKFYHYLIILQTA